MNDKASLLEQLRLDRSEQVEAPARHGRGWAAAGVIVVALSAAAAWLLWPAGVPVATAIAELAPGDDSTSQAASSVLDASGYVVARRQATVSAKITGKVVSVSIEEGQRVEEGQLIAQLDDTVLRAAVAQARAERDRAQASLVAAQVALENAEPLFRRNRQQFERAVVSAQTFDTAKAAYDSARTGVDVAARALDVADATLALTQRNLDDTIVRAPFAGVVTVKAAQEGEMVSPISAGGGFTRTGIGTIVDMDSLEVEVDVSESFINRVRPGQPVSVTLNAYPDWTIPAHVIAIIPTADRAKATVKVRVALGTSDPRILPQMGVRVAFLEAQPAAGGPGVAHAARPLLVPAAAVQANGDVGVVYVVGDGKVERRDVRLGARVGANQVVLSGLTAGTRVAVGALAELGDGMKVKVLEAAR